MVRQHAAICARLSALQHSFDFDVVVGDSWPRTIVACKLLARKIADRAGSEAGKAKAEARAELKKELVSPGSSRAYKLLRDPPPRKL
eukprot:6905789-Alexandrium_andersonii.AAC.1